MPEIKHRVIIDTNLWISFLLTHDSARLDQLFSENKLTLLVSQELLDEIVEVALRPKFRKYFELDDLTDLLISLRQKAQFVHVTSAVDKCRDEKDNFLLSLAIDGNATHLITGDKDLLALHPFEHLQILKMAEYILSL